MTDAPNPDAETAARLEAFNSHVVKFFEVCSAICQYAFGGHVHPVQDSFHDFRRAYGHLNDEEHVLLFQKLVHDYPVILQEPYNNADWLTRDVIMMIGNYRFMLGNIYVRAKEMKDRAIKDTVGLTPEARASRNEIDFPIQFLFHLYTVLVIGCGFENELAGLKNRLVVIQELLEIPMENTNPQLEALKPIGRIARNMADSAIKGNANLPKPFVGAYEEFTNRITSSDMNDLPGALMGALTGTLKSEHGTALMNMLKSAMGSDQLTNSVFSHMTESTSIDDALKRADQIASDPNVQEAVRQRVNAQAAEMNRGGGAPIDESMIATEDFPTGK